MAGFGPKTGRHTGRPPLFMADSQGVRCARPVAPRSASCRVPWNRDFPGMPRVRAWSSSATPMSSARLPVDERVPPLDAQHQPRLVTAEYGMLPARPTPAPTARRREAASRAHPGDPAPDRAFLRAVVDLPPWAKRQINIDCDVLQADGGTRTASITGSWVALHFAFERLVKEGKIAANPITGQVAAVSCGLWEGTAVLDLDYPEDPRPRPTPISC